MSFRYLLHVFMEAGCLEWCVVIGLILRDANVIKQVISFLDNPEVPPETVQSVRNGLLAVDTWASTDWFVRYFIYCSLKIKACIGLFRSHLANLFLILYLSTARVTNHFST